MRMNLKVFRVRHKLTQKKMAEKIGCERGTYTAIEKGTRDGRHEFWEKLRNAFEIPESEMWELMKNE